MNTGKHLILYQSIWVGDNMEIEFKSVRELFERVTPALKSKVRELKRNNITYINEIDIWNCCKELYWKKSNSLSLASMVNDILNTKTDDFEKYMMSLIKQGD